MLKIVENKILEITKMMDWMDNMSVEERNESFLNEQDEKETYSMYNTQLQLLKNLLKEFKRGE